MPWPGILQLKPRDQEESSESESSKEKPADKSADQSADPRREQRSPDKSEEKSTSEEQSSEDKSRSQEKSSNDAASERREEAARAQKKAEDQAMWGPFGPVKAFSIAGLEVARQAGFLKNGAWAEEKVRCPCCWLLKPRSTMHTHLSAATGK